MNRFNYLKNELYCEDVPVSSIAKDVGTPFYLYSYYTLVNHYRAFDAVFRDIPHIVCYAYKANSNLSLCRLLAEEGCGADVVSWGEMRRALEAGVPPEKIVFNGNGKTEQEIENAVRTSILMFIVDSEPEMLLLDRIAGRFKRKARIALRVNPAISLKTHRHLATGLRDSKFGFACERALEAYRVAKTLSNLQPEGVHMHIGSQILDVRPFVSALKKIISLVEAIRKEGIEIKWIDLGGGIGITYQDEIPPTLKAYAKAVIPYIKKSGCRAIFEPGRVIVGNAGVLITRVSYVKDTPVKKFVVVDAGMSDLIRPTLYDAYHQIKPVAVNASRKSVKVDVVGPICESGDYFAKERSISEVKGGELLAIFSAGAYGFSMSSNYNLRPLPAEVLVKGSNYFIIRKREVYSDMVVKEAMPGILK